MGGVGKASRVGKPLSNAAILLQKTSHEARRAVIWITSACRFYWLEILPMDNCRKMAQDSVSGSGCPGTTVVIEQARIHAARGTGIRIFRGVIQLTSRCAAGHRIPMLSLSQYGRINRRFLWQP
jgi:hypothetical protein